MKISQKIHASVLIVACALLAHYVISSLPLRLDMTADHLYTLSDSTKTLLEKVEDPITLELYSSKSLGELPPWFKSFADRVEQTLAQYERAGGGKITFRVIDPKPDTVEEETATAAGLVGQDLPSGDKVYLGLLAIQGDTEKTISFFDWNKEDFLEYDISKIIYETQQFTKKRLGVLTTLPLRSPGASMMTGQQQHPDQYILENWSTTFDIEDIDPTASELPADIDMLAIVHPQDLSEELLYQIDQFALSGKPIFLALDASSMLIREQAQQMQAMGGMQHQEASSDLPGILSAWGIDYDPSKVVVDPNISINQAQYFQPSWLVFNKENTNQDLLPSSEIEGVLMLDAAPLKPAANATTAFTPVLTTSDEAGTADAAFMQFMDGRSLMKQYEVSPEPIYIAALVTGEAQSAFPDGKPDLSNQPDVTEDETAASSENAAIPSLKQGDITVFVISDSDWLLDRFSIQRVDFFGTQAIQPQNDNQTLAANFADYLGGSRDLIGIRSKGKTARNFDVVVDMQTEAQKAYQTKLEELEGQISAVSQKISTLLNEQRGNGLIVATPEIQAVLEEQRAQEASLKAERRKIRRELRQGIESLGMTISIINLAWAPIALLAFGLYFNRLRKQK